MPDLGRHCGGCKGYLPSWEECDGLGTPELTSILEEKLMTYARCNLDGRPVHPRDARVIEAFTETLRARESGTKPGLRWRELRQDAYWQEWYCEPPRPGDQFRVTHEEWAEENGQPVRRVYEIEVTHGAAGSPAGPDSDGRAGPGPGPAAGREAPAAPV